LRISYTSHVHIGRHSRKQFEATRFSGRPSNEKDAGDRTYQQALLIKQSPQDPALFPDRMSFFAPHPFQSCILSFSIPSHEAGGRIRIGFEKSPREILMQCDVASPVSRLQELMSRYQQADPTAVRLLVNQLSPQLFRFFASQMGSRTDAEDMLQDLWLRIHQARHTYRPGKPVLPWVYAIARFVRTDSYRQRRRIASRELAMDILPEPSGHRDESTLSFEDLVAPLSERQRAVVTMLKMNGMSIEEVARASASTIGAVKQDAHRAYKRLRRVMEHSPAALPGRKRWNRIG
jgi:RNA polymerase sigma-70 factor, ECF subfamily